MVRRHSGDRVMLWVVPHEAQRRLKTKEGWTKKRLKKKSRQGFWFEFFESSNFEVIRGKTSFGARVLDFRNPARPIRQPHCCHHHRSLLRQVLSKWRMESRSCCERTQLATPEGCSVPLGKETHPPKNNEAARFCVHQITEESHPSPNHQRLSSDAHEERAAAKGVQGRPATRKIAHRTPHAIRGLCPASRKNVMLCDMQLHTIDLSLSLFPNDDAEKYTSEIYVPRDRVRHGHRKLLWLTRSPRGALRTPLFHARTKRRAVPSKRRPTAQRTETRTNLCRIFETIHFLCYIIDGRSGQAIAMRPKIN